MFPFTLHQLRILKAIATQKNFTRAAETLYLSQPSVSKQMKLLENNLDTLLIGRKKNQVFLTRDGEIFLKYSERILALCEESCRALVDLKNGDRGNIVINTNQAVGNYLLPKLFAPFTQTYPEVTLKIGLDSAPVFADRINDKQIDLAIVSEEMVDYLRESNFIPAEYFMDEELSLVLSKCHPLAKKKMIREDEIYCLDYITLSSKLNSQNYIEEILVQNQIKVDRLKIVGRLDSIESVKIAVSLGLGAAFLPEVFVEKEVKSNAISSLHIEGRPIIKKLFIIGHSTFQKSSIFECFYLQLTKLKSGLID